jgi:uncharacterized protein (TIGR01777 family)
MRVAVTGTSGLIGSALVRRLEVEGHEVIRLVRRPAERLNEVEWHPLSSEVEERQRLEGLDGMVNLAGSNLSGGRWTAQRKDEILRSRVEGTRTLVAVMAHLNHRPRTFVNASAVGFYGDRAEEELTERSGQGRGFLAGVCHDWEEQAAIAGSVGIRSVMLRLGLVLGRGGGVLARLAPVFRAGFGGALGNGRQWVSWIALDDAVGAILHALRETGLAGPVNTVAPAPARNAEFSDALARALGHRTFAPVPAFVLRAVFCEMADEMLLASARVRPQRLLESGFRFEHPELSGALRAALATK